MNIKRLKLSFKAILLPKSWVIKLQRDMILLFFLSVFHMSVYASASPKDDITIRMNLVRLESVIDYIESSTDYAFIFQQRAVDPNKIVSINVKDVSIEKAMDLLLDQSSIDYVITGHQIILKKSAKGVVKKVLKGTVLDNQGDPVIGAVIRAKDNRSVGTVTDVDGNFTLNIDTKYKVLSVSYIGMKSVDITPVYGTLMKIVLEEQSEALGEVVVTALGIERKAKSLTYSTQSIKNDEVVRAKDVNFINSLQGKSAGLTITPNAGGAGSASKILLRGNSSIEGNNSPLIVVDGIPMSNTVDGQLDAKSGGYNMAYGSTSEGGDAISNINPEDIANITILKGANAAALYGSGAANGVIMIKTKQGREGKLRVNFSSNSTFESPLKLPDLQNSFGAPVYDGQLSGRSWGKKITQQTDEENAIQSVSSSPNNRIKDFFKTGYNLTNSVSISGGTSKVQSYFSFSNTTSQGMVPNNKFSRNNFTIRQTYNFFDEKLTLNLSGNYISQKTRNRVSGGTVYNPLYNLYLAPRNLNMDYYKNTYEKEGTWVANPIKIIPKYTGGIGRTEYWKTDHMLHGNQQEWFQGRGVPSANNPYWLVNKNKGVEKRDRIMGSIELSYKINEKLNIQTRASYDKTVNDKDFKKNATTVGPTGQFTDRGSYSWSNDNRSEFFGDLLLNYADKIVNNITVQSTVGGSFKKSNGDSFWMLNSGASSSAYYQNEDNLPTSINVFYPNASYATQRSFRLSSDWSRAVLATMQLGFYDALFIDFSYRIDWSRAFSQFKTKGVKDYYGYYSLGGTVVLSDLINLGRSIDRFKFRSSYSEVGNSIPNRLYSEQPYDPATGRIKAATYTNFDHPLPETVRSFETGIDLDMFRNRLSVDISLYSATMFNQYLPITSAIGSIKPINTGKVRNQGIELDVSSMLLKSGKFRWNIGANFSYNDNEILKTYQDRKDIHVSIGTSDNIRVKFLKGGSYGDIYSKDFTRMRIFDVQKYAEKGITVKEGDIKLNPDGTPSMDAKGGHRVYLGNMNSKINIGLNSTFIFGDASLYVLIDGRIGGKVISFTEAYLDSYGVSQRSADARLSDKYITRKSKDPVTRQEVIIKDPAVVMPDGNLASAEKYYQTIGDQIFPTEYVYDATNFRIRELSLGYTFRDIFGSGNNLKASIVGRNLLFLYNDCPIDPDTSISTQNALGGVDVFGLPPSRSIGINLKMTF
ncbi:SusC/RagA family TonB-linked outer membrane protein [Halosquirtibacter laminarini]|uniref:SusC/RagA family TonB-linked outer membrane protein n=1 Tax=Halosquirtibacter laminarini TaxID=3374600 RepID=A0AC61NR22_9BACT|nr:SusC/RagA family TonB-linked outer membrane protein [Prolixibacteraceae bacterium]